MNKRCCPSRFLISASFKEMALPLLIFKLALFSQLAKKDALRSHEQISERNGRLINSYNPVLDSYFIA